MRLALCALVAVACGGNKSANVDAPGATGDAPAGSNTITGTVSGTNFNTVGSTHWIGMPDSPSTDTVIYVFDRSIACNQLTQAGWDSALPSGTQILELKMVGKTPMPYPITTAATRIPAPGESISSYTVAMPTATDMVASSGSVTLTALGQPTMGTAAGSFHLILPGGSLDGMYEAPYCSTGREP